MQRTAEAPPQAVLTQRTAEVPPQAAPTRCATLTPGYMAAAGSRFGVWILGFHWRSRVSWGPTCGPSHIGLLLMEAVSEVSRPAFTLGQV